MVKRFKALARVPRSLATGFKAAVGFEELHLYGGVLLAGLGAYLMFPPAGFIVAGIALFGIGWVK